MTTTTAPKIQTCSRCKGSGMVTSGVAHCGIPGLCYSCDGGGKTVVFTMKQRVEKYIARCEKHLAELGREAAQLKADHESTPARNERSKARRGRRVDTQLEELRAIGADQ